MKVKQGKLFYLVVILHQGRPLLTVARETAQVDPDQLQSSRRQIWKPRWKQQKSAALLLLTAKERYWLTQSALNFIVHQIQQMM